MAKDTRRLKTRKKARSLRPTLPNKGVELFYRRRLQSILDKLKGVHQRIAVSYSLVVPRFSAPGRAVKVHDLDSEIEEAYAPLLEEVEKEAQGIAEEFVKRAGVYTRTALIAALAYGGINARVAYGADPDMLETVITPESSRVTLIRPPNMDDIQAQSIRDNVALISNIPDEDRRRIERMVRDSIRNRRDLHGLQTELQGIEDIGFRRARIIARDQNNKITEDITRERNKALGITHGIWMHRGGSKNPRETHMAFNGQVFDLEVGLYDSDVGRKVLPAELISCHCTFKAVLPDTL